MSNNLQKAVTRVLSPLARLLLRHGVSHAEFVSWAKQAYVKEATEHFGIDGKTPTVSRTSIVTGINRKEVKRILDLPDDVQAGINKHNRAVRVVTGWLQDDQFQQPNGEPAILTYGDNSDSFNQLVRQYGGDVPARALLDELVHVGTVKLEESKVALVTKGYVPHESEEAMLDVFATSATDLLNTLDHNISGEDKRRLQMSVAYDNISVEALAAFKKLSADKALKLLREFDKTLATHEKTNPPAKGEARYRTGLGIYFIEDAIDDVGVVKNDGDNDEQ